MRKLDLMKNAILGKDYNLSLAFVSKKVIRKFNRIYRKIDKPTDVLSFSYARNEGEILICKEIAGKKSSDFGMTAGKYLLFIFLHAMLHLKGMRHGSRMESEEAKWRKKFQLE